MARSRTFTVALVGADGSGKSTLAKRLVGELRLPAKYLYMGVNLDTSRLVLPTTWLILNLKRALGGRPNMAGPPDPTRRAPRSRSWLKWSFAEAKSALRLANLAAEEWFRQVLAWSYQRRGFVVLFDRHFYLDFCGHELAHPDPSPSLSRRLHTRMLERIYPRPDLVIYLDAPAEVLFARKGEGTIELLELRRQEYLRLGALVQHFAVVDGARGLDEVAADVAKLIRAFAAGRQYHPCPAAISGAACTAVKGGAG
jgi:thymidylate kinase